MSKKKRIVCRDTSRLTTLTKLEVDFLVRCLGSKPERDFILSCLEYSHLAGEMAKRQKMAQSPEKRSAQARRAAQARWKKKPK